MATKTPFMDAYFEKLQQDAHAKAVSDLEALKASPGSLVCITPEELRRQRQDMEAEIKAAGADKFPRITPQDIEDSILSEHFFTADRGVLGNAEHEAAGIEDVGQLRPVVEVMIPQPLHLLTFCVLVLRNGFTVTGESACASPENFNAEIGRKIARQNAVQKIWPLMGFALRERLAHSE